MSKFPTTVTITSETFEQMADRIEELEAAHANLKAMIADQINSTGDGPEIMAATRAEWAARAKSAEAKLAKLTKAADRLHDCYYDSSVFIAGMTDLIAELTGGKDE